MVGVVGHLRHYGTAGPPGVVGRGLADFGLCIGVVVDHILATGEGGREGGNEGGREWANKHRLWRPVC